MGEVGGGGGQGRRLESELAIRDFELWSHISRLPGANVDVSENYISDGDRWLAG